jgi:uncharacterized membrane protein YfcA
MFSSGLRQLRPRLSVQLQRTNAFRQLQGKSGARPAPKHPVRPETAVLIGGAAGVGAACTGLAGGVLIFPALNTITQLTVQQITAVTLLSTTAGCVAGSYQYTTRGVTDVPLALIVGGASVLSAGIGVYIGERVNNVAARRAAAIMLLMIAPCLALRERPSRKSGQDEGAAAAFKAPHPLSQQLERQWGTFVSKVDSACASAGAPAEPGLPAHPLSAAWLATALGMHADAVLLGLGIGVSQGFLGIGGGTAMAVYFTYQGMPQHTIIATALTATLVTNTGASLMHLTKGSLVGLALPTALIGASCALGSFFATQHLALHLPEEPLRKALAAYVFASGAGMLLKK